MGFETHVFAWADGSVGEHTADYFYPISIMEVDKILEMQRDSARCSNNDCFRFGEYYGE